MAKISSKHTKSRPGSARHAKKSPAKYDQFHETLAAPLPISTYRSETDRSAVPDATVQLIRYVAVIMTGLLALRFIINLFTSSSTNLIVGVLTALTDWLVLPIQAFFRIPPVTGGSAYVDIPALAAIIVTVAVSAILLRLAKAPRV